MRRRGFDNSADDDPKPVMVPRNERPPVPLSPERIYRLRTHLVTTLRRMRGRRWFATQVRPEPEGFAARVVNAACALCKGWCCKGGGDHAYLDEPTLARLRDARPDLSAHAVVRLYLERAPAVSYQGSCLFHGLQGCTLDRGMRSDVCNAYFCAGLDAFTRNGDPEEPVVVIAGEPASLRASPVLRP